jgi:hypothetical protein
VSATVHVLGYLLIAVFRGTEGELQVFDAIVGRLPNFEGLLSEFRKDPMLLDLFVAKVSDYMHTKSYQNIIHTDECRRKHSASRGYW